MTKYLVSFVGNNIDGYTYNHLGGNRYLNKILTMEELIREVDYGYMGILSVTELDHDLTMRMELEKNKKALEKK